MRHTILLLLISLLGFTTLLNADVHQRKDVQLFIDEMVEKHQFQRQYLEDLFRQVKFRPKLKKVMSRPAEALTWDKYRGRFLNPARVKGGVKYWRKHKKTLQQASKKYGVPEAIIVAIIGVESAYGGYQGKYIAFDAIATLAFDYPKRSAFFLGELEALLLLSREQKSDPRSYLGSYAGALGKGQFIPSSYRAYGVDFDQDGKRDLINNHADAIGSVANYFKRHGWRKDEPVVLAVKPKGDGYKKLLKKGLKPHIEAKALKVYGITPPSSLNERVLFIRLKTDQGYDNWLGLNNFYVITRYNHSMRYAMAVYQLSEAIRQRMK